MILNTDPHLTVLVLEDDENDAFLLRRALQRASICSRVVILPDGKEAVDYLSGHGIYADRAEYPSPDIILLDLKMPRMSGLDFLDWMQRNPGSRVIPSIVLSSSNQECDIQKAYALGANTYFVKPSEFNNLVNMMALVFHYWSHTVTPQKRPPTLVH